jgi:integrase
MRGTVFFRESKAAAAAGRGKKQGTWTYQFAVPKGGGGRRYVTKGGYATKRDAEAALTEALAEHGQGNAAKVEPSKMALAAFLRDEWLSSLVSVKPTTRAGYEHLVDRHIVPHLGDVRLRDLTTAQVLAFYERLRTSGRARATKDGRTGLSETTVHAVHVALGAALRHAVEAGQLRVSPVEQLPRKARPRVAKSRRDEMRTWTAVEAQQFLAAASGDRFAALFDLALNTGLRRGELAALRWADVDMDRAVLAVRRNRVLVRYAVEAGTPKGGRARTVDLDPGTVAMLRSHRVRQSADRLAWGEAWTDSGQVFTREDGTALHPQTLTWHLRRLTKLAGVPAIRVHDLRHTHATLGLAAGVPPKVMQERLGHASVQITLDLYSHVVPGMQADAAARIGALLRGCS